MQFTIVTILALATAAIALPTTAIERRQASQVTLPDGTIIPAGTFTNFTCTLSKGLTPGEPLSFLFPTADALGLLIGPTLTNLIGANVVNDIDLIAEDLCIDAEQEPADGDGVCQLALQAINDFIVAKDEAQADKYRCLLNLLCVAHINSVPEAQIGTCQYLLSGADCVANRLIGVGDVECPTQSGSKL